MKYFSAAMPEHNSLKENERTKLSKKINLTNIEDMFRLILLIYGRVMKKYL